MRTKPQRPAKYPRVPWKPLEVMTNPRLVERYWSRVDRTGGEDACWPWTHANRTTFGYGVLQGSIAYEKYSLSAHRIAFALHHGREAIGWVLHSCDNPPCCNPVHLREGSGQDNMDDRTARGRVRVGRKARDFTEAERSGAVAMRIAGASLREVAASVGCHVASAQRWCADAGLARVRGENARGRGLPTTGYVERALSFSWRHEHRAARASGARHDAAECGQVGAAGNAPTPRLESPLGPAPQSRQGALNG